MSNPSAGASGQCKKEKGSATDAASSSSATASDSSRRNKETTVLRETTNDGDINRDAGATTGGGGASGGPNSFEFVLVNDSGSRKQVRRHAMRRYIHQRRLDGIARLESSRVQVPGWVKGKPANNEQTGSSLKVEELDDDDDDDDNGGDGKSEKVVSGPKEGNSSDAAAIGPKAAQRRQQPQSSSARHGLSSCKTAAGRQLTQVPASTSPQLTTPSSVASDPFNSFPMQLHQSDRKLIHHFVNTYPLMMYQMGDPHHDNPIKAIFHHLALNYRVSFQAMLAIASKHSAGVGGHVETVQSITHKMRALRVINQELNNDVGDVSDGLLYAVATMAVIEKWSKETPVERVHFQAVRHLIRKRGGMRGLRASSQFMENIMCWVDFSCGPKAIYGASLPWTGEMPNKRPSNLPFLAPPHHVVTANLRLSFEIKDYEILDYVQSCEDFLSFFRSLYELEQALLSQPSALVQQGPPCGKSKTFEPLTPLYTILTSLPDYDHGIRDVRFIDEYTNMACLLYLNVALYDHYCRSRNFTYYLNWVCQQLQGSTSHLNSSLTSLLWIFLNNGGFAAFEAADEGERNWVVSRMLRVIKRMEWKCAGAIWNSLRAILVQFLLTQQECEIGGDQISQAALAAREARRQSTATTALWDEAEMRKNILGWLYDDPTVSSAVHQLRRGQSEAHYFYG